MAKYKNDLISIVTVMYKDDKYLPGFLSSINKLDYPKSLLEVIIVSILASDKSINIKKIPLKHIRINHRVGYAEAVNTGISKSLGQYLFLPNPDTIVEKSALKKMVQYLESHENVGLVGPKVFSMDNPENISSSDLPCAFFNRLTGRIIPVTAGELAVINKPQEFYWLCGNGIVVKRTAWEQAEKYDESFFLYWEDADFNMKVRSRGYKSVMIPEAKLFHKGSASVGNTDDQVYYIVRNGRYFINKYSRFPGHVLLHLADFTVISAKLLQILFRKHDREKTQAFIDGILDFYRGKRGIREEAKAISIKV